MPEWLTPVLYALVLTLAVSAGAAQVHRGRVRRPRVSLPVVLLWLVVAVPSVLQLVFPGLEDALRRDPAAILEGQVWRLLTSAVVQDGGVAGTVFNLIALALVAVLAGQVWGGGRLWILCWGAQLVTNTVIVLGSGPGGAGNSIATFAVGMTLVTLAASGDGRRAVDIVRLAAATLLAVTLFALRDIHGIAVSLGLVFGLAHGLGPARWREVG